MVAVDQLEGGNTYPTQDDTIGPISLSQMQHVGPGGENGHRYMLGYAANVPAPHVRGPKDYYVVIQVNS